MSVSTICKEIFSVSIDDYHVFDDVDKPISNPYPERSFEFFLYLKNWIDTVQWHLEDIIRNPQIDPAEALVIKRRIDKSNQERTDLVELIDSWFLQKYNEVQPDDNAGINTESPAWAIDRLSILQLKIYHWQIEAERTDASEEHINNAKDKMYVLLDQQTDLSASIDILLDEIATGKKRMKVYKQLKMYNDPNLNPVLYAGGKG
jgi:hypothetical protein